jgi:hypothetical protein
MPGLAVMLTLVFSHYQARVFTYLAQDVQMRHFTTLSLRAERRLANIPV